MISNNSKSWMPFIFLLILVSFVVIYVFLGDLFVSTRQPVQPSPGCIAVQNNGDQENSIDIVFLPDNFQSVEKFREKTDKMIESFKGTKPYVEYGDRFNFFRIEQFDLILKCDYKYGGDAIVCDPSSVKKSATLCPHDYVIVAVDSEGIQNLFDLLRSSAWMGIASLNTADDPLVFSHEFAHLFANFADEYEYGGKISWDAPNCDSSWETCPKFNVVGDSECVQGCVNNENSRSINVGIMRDYWKSKVYGSYNEHILTAFILKNTKASSNDQIAKSMPINIVQLNYIDNNWQILNVEESVGYPDGFNQGAVSTFKVVVENENYENIFELDLPLPVLYLDGHDSENNPYYDAVLTDGVIYTVSVPKTDKESRIVVKNNNRIVSAYNLQKNQIESISYNKVNIGIPQTFSSS